MVFNIFISIMVKEVFQFILVVLLISASPGRASESREDEILLRGKRQTEKATSYFYYQEPQYPRDCQEVYDQCDGQSADGIYWIKPDDSPEPFKVYCNNSIDGGGWTVFQRRMDGSVEFYLDWDDYKNGFGFLRREFWLDNDKLSYLTNQKNYELRIDLSSYFDYFAKYKRFRIGDEGSKYRLVSLWGYNPNSTVGFDAFSSSRNRSFSTRDRENDVTPDRHCATYTHGAWWYGPSSNFTCGNSMLNNLWNAGGAYREKSIRWYRPHLHLYNLKYTEMKIRPLPNS